MSPFRIQRASPWRTLGLLALGLVAVPAAGVCQAGPDRPPEGPAPSPITPRGAFVRAMIVPGWGHASLGSYNRGGFYFAFETLTWYTLLRTRSRLGEAHRRLDFREGVLTAQLAGTGTTDPQEVEDALAADPDIADLRGLIDSREQQQEDLIAFGLFLILLSGVDAYVSAHLADFPTPIELETASGPVGGTEVTVRVSLPW